MATPDPAFEEILGLVKQLTPEQKLRLIEEIMPDLEQPLQRAAEGEKSLRSLDGLWKDFGIRIRAEEIDFVTFHGDGSWSTTAESISLHCLSGTIPAARLSITTPRCLGPTRAVGSSPLEPRT